MARQLPADAGGPTQQTAIHISRQGNEEIRVIVRHVLSLETLGIVLCNETGIEIPRHKFGVGKKCRLKRDVAGDAANHKAIECFAHLCNRIEPV